MWVYAQMAKNLPAMQETRVRSLHQEDPLEKGMAIHSILAWRIPWTEEPGRLQSMGSQRVRHGCKLYDVWWLYSLAGAVLTKYHKPGSLKTGICLLTILEARNSRSWCGQGWFLLRAERESAPSSFPWSDALLGSLGFLGVCCLTQSLPLSQSGVLVCVCVQTPAFYNHTSHNRLGVHSTLVWLHVNWICNALISK